MTNKWTEYQEKDFSTRGAEIASTSLNCSRVKIALSYVGKNKKVLDLGCNDGAITEEVARRGNDVLGVDLEKVITIAREKHTNLNFTSFDISESFPINDEEYDVIIATEIIEHIVDDIFFLQECYRILKKRGKLIISTPNVAFIRDRIRLLFGKYCEGDTHVRMYTFKTLHEKVMNVGFEIYDEKGYEYDAGGNFFYNARRRGRWYILEKILPKTFKAGIVLCALKPPHAVINCIDH